MKLMKESQGLDFTLPANVHFVKTEDGSKPWDLYYDGEKIGSYADRETTAKAVKKLAREQGFEAKLEKDREDFSDDSFAENDPEVTVEDEINKYSVERRLAEVGHFFSIRSNSILDEGNDMSPARKTQVEAQLKEAESAKEHLVYDTLTGVARGLGIDLKKVGRVKVPTGAPVVLRDMVNGQHRFLAADSAIKILRRKYKKLLKNPKDAPIAETLLKKIQELENTYGTFSAVTFASGEVSIEIPSSAKDSDSSMLGNTKIVDLRTGGTSEKELIETWVKLTEFVEYRKNIPELQTATYFRALQAMNALRDKGFLSTDEVARRSDVFNFEFQLLPDAQQFYLLNTRS
jgi:hypothetical protein